MCMRNDYTQVEIRPYIFIPMHSIECIYSGGPTSHVSAECSIRVVR